MKTPEEIKKGLECFSNNWIGIREDSCGDCEYLKTEGISDETKACRWGLIIIDAIDCIQRLEAQVQKWISAKEPPKKWEDDDGTLINYLVYMPEYGVDVANYFQPANTWVCLGFPCKVTHWMPLPELPEEDEHGT